MHRSSFYLTATSLTLMLIGCLSSICFASQVGSTETPSQRLPIKTLEMQLGPKAEAIPFFPMYAQMDSDADSDDSSLTTQPPPPSIRPTPDAVGVGREGRRKPVIERERKSNTEVTETATKPVVNLPKKLEPGQDSLVLNLDQADLNEVIRKLANLLEINYIASPNIKGKVSIFTAGRIQRRDLLSVFFQILKVNGLTAIREGQLYHILPLPDAARLPITARLHSFQTAPAAHDTDSPASPGKPRNPIEPIDSKLRSENERVVIQIIPLKYVSVSEMVNVLKPLVSTGGTIVTHPGSNSMLVVDTLANLNKILQLVLALDIHRIDQVAHRAFLLKHQDAEQMAKDITGILPIYGEEINKQTRILALSRLNLLLVVSAKPVIIDAIASYVTQLDLPADQTRPQIFVYGVKSSNAKSLSEVLTAVFTQTDDKKKSAVKAPSKSDKQPFTTRNPAVKKTRKQTTPPKATVLSNPDRGTGILDGEVKIIPDENRNLLIIQASEPDYRKVLALLRELDIAPRQVLIEVIVAEITLDDSTELGVEWNFDKTRTSQMSWLNIVSGATGFNYTIGLTERWLHSLNALAKDEKVNILSSPSVLASDSQEANINVSSQLPVVSSEFEFEENNTQSENVVKTNIQYRDTGIILSVTPHISERGLVTMDIRQEVSEQGQGVEIAGKQYPSFLERKVDTTLSVPHGHTIVIGGLMREVIDKTKVGVPYLVKIPILGALFGTHNNSVQKTELVFMITPRVVLNVNDIDDMTLEFKRKVTSIFDIIAEKKSLPPLSQPQNEAPEKASKNKWAPDPDNSPLLQDNQP